MFTWLHHYGAGKGVSHNWMIPCHPMPQVESYWQSYCLDASGYGGTKNHPFSQHSFWKALTILQCRYYHIKQKHNSTISSVIPKVVSRWRVPCNPSFSSQFHVRQLICGETGDPYGRRWVTWPIPPGGSAKAQLSRLSLSLWPCR